MYKARIKVLMAIFDKNFPKTPEFPNKLFDVFIRGATLRSWKQKQIQVNGREVTISLRI